MGKLELHRQVIAKLNNQVHKIPTFDQLQTYFSEAIYMLEDCPGAKEPFTVSGYVKRTCQKMYEYTQDESYWDMYWDCVKWEAPHRLDSYCIYIERNRPAKERFYLPRRKTLLKVTDMFQRMEEDELDESFIHLPPRAGKLLADDTPVLTSKGWKNHGDLAVGDRVIGSDGKFTKIVAVHPKHHTTHTVVFSDGTEIECHYRHEWTVYDRHTLKVKTLETQEMIGKTIYYEKEKSRSRFFIPDRQVFIGEEKTLEVHPYVFGAWIGDGTTSKPWITDPESDSAIFNKIADCGYPVHKVYTHKVTGVKSVCFDKLKDGLQKYGLCGRYDRDTKYIPDVYLTASVPQRLELLAGLLDTDGTLNKKEHRYQFSTTNEKIRDGVVALVNTFGWRTCVTEQKPHTSSYGIEGKKVTYVISFNPTIFIPCVLERKQLQIFSKKRRIAIVEIRESTPKSGNCITVENSDGIYCVGKHLMPTHNSQMCTMAMAWHICRNPESNNLYCTYKESLGGAFLDGVIEILTDPTYLHGEVFPQTNIAGTDAKAHKLWLNRKRKYATLSGKGLESGLNGEYDANGWLLIDDILEGIQDVLSPDVLKRKQIIFDNNLMSRKKEKAKVVYNGTIWSLHDIFSDRLEFVKNSPTTKDLRVDVLKIPALDPQTDESNFNYDYGVGFSTEYFRTLRAKFERNDDMASWCAQYQQEPIERDGAVFNPEHMNFYNGVLPDEEPIRICAACDVALGGLDYLSMPIAYIFADGSVYIHDVVFSNEEKDKTQPMVVRAIIENHVGSLQIENNNAGSMYKDEINKMLIEQGNRINIVGKWTTGRGIGKGEKAKQQRIWDKAPEIREFYFRDEGSRSPMYSKFMTNVYSFTVNGRNVHDDAPDSLAMLADFIKNTGVRTARIIKSPI